jgi:hypothetical protein
MSKMMGVCGLCVALVVIGLAKGGATTSVSTTSGSTTAVATSAPATISWDQAKNHVGEVATVIGKVIGAHSFGDSAVLNVGKDYPDPGRFTVYISDTSGMPEDMFVGVTIAVTGKVVLYKHVPEIESDVKHIVDTAMATTGPSTTP